MANKQKNILICVDRDGTLIYDNHYHLGSQKNWKSKVKILPYVSKGLNLLNQKIPEAKIYITTNQPGIAVKNLHLLTMKRAKEVSNYIIKKIKNGEKIVKGVEVCGLSSKKYVKKRPQFIFDKKMVKEDSCIKPKPGMVKKILKKNKWSKKDTQIYVLGDRFVDVQTGLNIGGTGILIPFKNRAGEDKLVKKLKNKNGIVVKNFLEACKLIIEKEKKSPFILKLPEYT